MSQISQPKLSASFDYPFSQFKISLQSNVNSSHICTIEMIKFTVDSKNLSFTANLNSSNRISNYESNNSLAEEFLAYESVGFDWFLDRSTLGEVTIFVSSEWSNVSVVAHVFGKVINGNIQYKSTSINIDFKELYQGIRSSS